ncbi:MAG: 5-formyltetrahydrofolate cyclo-ligase [Caulobacter sp.]|nr:5-formyltetrahydrofolate cyclo-ligase [Caulobacter sp.]
MVHASDASAKTVLRLAMRRQRKQLAEEHPEAHWQAADWAKAPLKERFPSADGRIAALYKALGYELDPAGLGAWLANRGWRLALPVTPPADEPGPLTFKLWTPGDRLEPGVFKVSEPLSGAETVEPDLIVTPLLAFDRAGGRLGYGQGHFDRTLEQLRARKPVFVLGFAYSAQEVAEVPAEDHDQALDAIVTERGYIGVRKDS